MPESSFESKSPLSEPSCQGSCACMCICGCLCLLSNNFHISLILKGQKLLGSQQWADDSWLNMHLIPFGRVSVSKPPTFLSHNHSYRFSIKFRSPVWTEMTSDQHSPIVSPSKEMRLRTDVGRPHRPLLAVGRMATNFVILSKSSKRVTAPHRITRALHNDIGFHLNVLLIKSLQPQPCLTAGHYVLSLER